MYKLGFAVAPTFISLQHLLHLFSRFACEFSFGTYHRLNTYPFIPLVILATGLTNCRFISSGNKKISGQKLSPLKTRFHKTLCPFVVHKKPSPFKLVFYRKTSKWKHTNALKAELRHPLMNVSPLILLRAVSICTGLIL